MRFVSISFSVFLTFIGPLPVASALINHEDSLSPVTDKEIRDLHTIPFVSQGELRQMALEIEAQNQLEDKFGFNERNAQNLTIFQANQSPYIWGRTLDTKERKLVSQTKNFLVLGAASVGFIMTLPEEISKWDLDELKQKSLMDRYRDNVKSGPVWDKDEWEVNYIGHPVSGAIEYRAARDLGFSRSESFLYSVFVSTVIWEYGFEAFAEVPSIQDLIVTPVLGSLLGEGMYILERKIRDNDGKVLGSQWLGNVSMVFLNPGKPFLEFVESKLSFKGVHSVDLHCGKHGSTYPLDDNTATDMSRLDCSTLNLTFWFD